VYVVAIAELNGAIEAETGPLASDLGITAYETRLLLAPGTPALVLTTVDKEQAIDLVARLRARGHVAIAFDASAVVASRAMTSMRRFRLHAESISLDDQPNEQLPYESVVALVAAVHRQRTQNEGEVRERKLSVGRAVMSGGLVMTRTVKHDTRSVTEGREPVLYLFRRGAGTPWILRERGTSWVGLGRPVVPLAADNFRSAVGALRERMPRAAYDDRLVTRRSAPERMLVVGGAGSTTRTTSSEAGIDLLAHLVALALTRARVALDPWRSGEGQIE
jgi:hypothetical protein